MDVIDSGIYLKLTLADADFLLFKMDKQNAWSYPGDYGEERKGNGGPGGVRALVERHLIRRGPRPLIGQEAETYKVKKSPETWNRNRGLKELWAGFKVPQFLSKTPPSFKQLLCVVKDVLNPVAFICFFEKPNMLKPGF